MIPSCLLILVRLFKNQTSQLSSGYVSVFPTPSLLLACAVDPLQVCGHCSYSLLSGSLSQGLRSRLGLIPPHLCLGHLDPSLPDSCVHSAWRDVSDSLDGGEK